MSGFQAGYQEIKPRELVHHLLQVTGQYDHGHLNPAELLRMLGLEYLSFDFALELPIDAQTTAGRAKPRALLSIDDKTVATDSSLSENRTRFSVLHEIGHYMLPSHQHSLYLCDAAGLSFAAQLVMEKEASEFAADLLFLGDRFSLEANSHPVCARTVKELADKYHASYEATARRLVQKSFKPCMLVAFQKAPVRGRDELSETPRWVDRYCVPSPSFRTRFSEKVSGTVPPEIVELITAPARDIADSHLADVSIRLSAKEQETQFQVEYFYNRWNIFCFLAPK